jgi:hypothetical protein
MSVFYIADSDDGYWLSSPITTIIKNHIKNHWTADGQARSPAQPDGGFTI